MPAGEMRQRGEDTLTQLSPSSAGCLSGGRRGAGGVGGSADQSAGAMPAAGEQWERQRQAGKEEETPVVTMKGNERAAREDVVEAAAGEINEATLEKMQILVGLKRRILASHQLKEIKFKFHARRWAIRPLYGSTCDVNLTR